MNNLLQPQNPLSEQLADRMFKDRKVRRAITRESHFLFFHFYFAHYVTHPTAPFHFELFRLTEDDSVRNLVVVAFRDSGKSTLMTTSYPLWAILGSQAKLENDHRGVNVKRGLRTRVEMGLWPGVAPLGYLNQNRQDKKCQIIVDPTRAPVIKQMFEKVANEKWSGRKIYNWLREVNFYTRGNKPLTLAGVYRVLDQPFYYGMFEYPRKSGQWYQGKHKPIINKALFEKAQAQLKRDQIVRENKEFAFTKLFTCGYCQSGISAEEKYKQLKDGTSAKYVYYGCTRARDRNCKNKYIREEELVPELLKIIDQVNINELGMRHKLEDEIKRFHKFQHVVLKDKTKRILDDEEVNIRIYAKYLLKEGSVTEKHELLANLRSRLIYKDKTLTLMQEA